MTIEEKRARFASMSNTQVVNQIMWATERKDASVENWEVYVKNLEDLQLAIEEALRRMK